MYKMIETPREALVVTPGTKVSMEEVTGKIVVCDDSFPISLACEASSVVVGGERFVVLPWKEAMELKLQLQSTEGEMDLGWEDTIVSWEPPTLQQAEDLLEMASKRPEIQRLYAAQRKGKEDLREFISYAERRIEEVETPQKFLFESAYYGSHDERGWGDKLEVFYFKPEIDLVPWKGSTFGHWNSRSVCGSTSRWNEWLETLEDADWWGGEKCDLPPEEVEAMRQENAQARKRKKDALIL